MVSFAGSECQLAARFEEDTNAGPRRYRLRVACRTAAGCDEDKAWAGTIYGVVRIAAFHLKANNTFNSGYTSHLNYFELCLLDWKVITQIQFNSE